MRNNKGFTLIELLAVIVILAIIALIATPIITGIIDDAKYNASARSVDGFMDAVNYKNTEAILTNKKMDDGRYLINENGNLIKDGKTYDLNVKGEKPIGGFVTIYKGKVIDGTIVVDGNVVYYSEEGTKVVKSDIEKIYGLEYDIEKNQFNRLKSAVFLDACVGTNTNACENTFDGEEIYKDMVEETDSYGNKFIKIPKLYIKKEVSDTRLAWYVSKVKQDDNYYLPNCFYDFTNNKELDYVLVGKYDASLSSDGKRLESKTNAIPLVLKSITDFREYARANNIDGESGYQQMDVHVWDTLQTLFTIEFATLDSQSIMKGYGSGVTPSETTYKPLSNINNSNYLVLTSSQAGSFRVGQRIDISTSMYARNIAKDRMITNIEKSIGKVYFDGDPVNITTSQMITNCANSSGKTDGILTSSGSDIDNTSGEYSMNYRGIENLYGNVWQFLDGVIVNNYSNGKGTIYVNNNASTYVSNSITSDYHQIKKYEKNDADGYVQTLGYDSDYPFAQFASLTTSTYAKSIYKDYFLQNSIPEIKIALAGGHWFRGNNIGMFLNDFVYNADYSKVHIGGRLVKKLK